MPFLLILSFLTGLVGLFFPPLLLVSFALAWILVRTLRGRVKDTRGAEQAKRDVVRDRELAQAFRYFA